MSFVIVAVRLLALDNLVNDGVDVGDIDFAITVDVTNQCAVIIVGSMAVAAAATIDDNMDHIVDIGNVDLAISIHVSHEYIFHNLSEIRIPVLISPVCIMTYLYLTVIVATRDIMKSTLHRRPDLAKATLKGLRDFSKISLNSNL